MKHLKENFCDECFQYAVDQVQTPEGDWLCLACADKNTCYECGVVTLEWRMMRVDGKEVRLCEDCHHDHKMENAPTVTNIIDMQNYAAGLLGY